MRAYSVEKQKNIKKKRAYGTRDSHVVPHHSTNLACTGLTSQFGRDTVCYREYGRRQTQWQMLAHIYLIFLIQLYRMVVDQNALSWHGRGHIQPVGEARSPAPWWLMYMATVLHVLR